MFYITGLNSGYTFASPSTTDAEARTNVELLKHDVDRLLLISQALWMLLKKEHGYTDDVLTDLITKIDSGDGKVDGRAVKDPPVQCPNCKRANSPTRPFCIYCGQPLKPNPFSR